MMTLRARALGMNRTIFRNASGLPDPEQVTTARDLAILARHLITDFPGYYGYFSTPNFVFHGRTIYNHDRMLRTYPGADGMKTGYTEASGHNLVTSAERGGVRLVGVVLGAASNPERDYHMAALLDQSFEQLDVPGGRRGTWSPATGPQPDRQRPRGVDDHADQHPPGSPRRHRPARGRADDHLGVGPLGHPGRHLRQREGRATGGDGGSARHRRRGRSCRADHAPRQARVGARNSLGLPRARRSQLVAAAARRSPLASSCVPRAARWPAAEPSPAAPADCRAWHDCCPWHDCC